MTTNVRLNGRPKLRSVSGAGLAALLSLATCMDDFGEGGPEQQQGRTGPAPITVPEVPTEYPGYPRDLPDGAVLGGAGGTVDGGGGAGGDFALMP
jgi:hypothetical protein